MTDETAMPTLRRPRSNSRLTAIVLVGLGILLGCVSSAEAKIIPGQSIDGVHLGDTKSQVRTQLHPTPGEIFQNTLCNPEFFFDSTVSLGLRVCFKHGRVAMLLSYSKKQRTPAGITIGSSRAEVKHAYPAAHCEEGEAGGYLYCVVGSHYKGRPSYTGFLFERTGGVVEVELGFGRVSEALAHP